MYYDYHTVGPPDASHVNSRSYGQVVLFVADTDNSMSLEFDEFVNMMVYVVAPSPRVASPPRAPHLGLLRPDFARFWHRPLWRAEIGPEEPEMTGRSDDFA